MERLKLSTILSQKQVEVILGVSPMTIYNWRKQTADPLPCRTIPTEGGRHRVYFPEAEVREWLSRNKPKLLACINQETVGGRIEHANSQLNSRGNAEHLSVVA